MRPTPLRVGPVVSLYRIAYGRSDRGGLAAAYLVDGLHDGGAHFRRERAEHGESPEGGQNLLLPREREQLDDGETNLVVRVAFDCAHERLHFARLCHQEEEREGFVRPVAALARQLRDGFAC